ncbi:MAG TPA: oligoribonuclease [Patescibacteria group bacterium]|nr:oligoribonuclease [Patescibacteria group bacterium]
MTDLKHDASSRLLWIDLEMTGLDVANDRIIEIAAIVTDFDFNELDTYESVIFQPPEVLSHMNEWSREATVANGLIDRIPAAPNEQHVVNEFSELIKLNFKEPAVLAGNSVHFDRAFIKQWWPDVFNLLHYRILDVSSFKIVMQNKYHVIFNKKETHRAMDDIRESMAELKFYLNYFTKK